MLEEAALEMGKQIPALIALVWLVARGLREMRNITERFLAEIRAQDVRQENMLKEMAEACHGVQRESIKAMNDVSGYLAQSTEAARALQEIVRRVENEQIRKGSV